MKTRNIWVIAPGENAEIWDDCKKENYIAIGWDEAGDIKNKSKEEIENMLIETYEEYQEKSPKVSAKMLYDFANEIAQGDIVIVRDGVTEIIGIGVDEGKYYDINDEDNPRKSEEHYKRVRKVKWLSTEKTKIKKGQFSRNTISKIDSNDDRIEDIPLKELLNEN
jgi:predicted Mrr-cat superfamily restriction endonuclease